MIKIDLDEDGGGYYVVEENGDIHYMKRGSIRMISSWFQSISQVFKHRRANDWNERFMRLYEHQLRKHPVNLF